MSNSVEPVATVVNGHTFTVDTRYVLAESRILGKGSFGVVCTAYDSVRRIDLAIKRIRPYANDDWDAKHTLREIRLLKLLGPHPNVSHLDLFLKEIVVIGSHCLCCILSFTLRLPVCALL
jgi:serine/threonine protein kinase